MSGYLGNAGIAAKGAAISAVANVTAETLKWANRQRIKRAEVARATEQLAEANAELETHLSDLSQARQDLATKASANSQMFAAVAAAENAFVNEFRGTLATLRQLGQDVEEPTHEQVRRIMEKDLGPNSTNPTKKAVFDAREAARVTSANLEEAQNSFQAAQKKVDDARGREAAAEKQLTACQKQQKRMQSPNWKNAAANVALGTGGTMLAACGATVGGVAGAAAIAAGAIGREVLCRDPDDKRTNAERMADVTIALANTASPALASRVPGGAATLGCAIDAVAQTAKVLIAYNDKSNLNVTTRDQVACVASKAIVSNAAGAYAASVIANATPIAIEAGLAVVGAEAALTTSAGVALAASATSILVPLVITPLVVYGVAKGFQWLWNKFFGNADIKALKNEYHRILRKPSWEKGFNDQAKGAKCKGTKVFKDEAPLDLTPKDLRKLYLRAVRQAHPDKTDNPAAVVQELTSDFERLRVIRTELELAVSTRKELQEIKTKAAQWVFDLLNGDAGARVKAVVHKMLHFLGFSVETPSTSLNIASEPSRSGEPVPPIPAAEPADAAFQINRQGHIIHDGQHYQQIDNGGDGHCMFLSIAQQLGGHQNNYSLRQACVAEIQRRPSEWDSFAVGGGRFTPQEKQRHLEHLLTDKWGGEHEINLLARHLQRQIWVYQERPRVLLQYGAECNGPNVSEPIRLFFINQNHYRSLDRVLTTGPAVSSRAPVWVTRRLSGHSFFRAVARVVLGDAEQFRLVRESCKGFMQQHKKSFEEFIGRDNWSNYFKDLCHDRDGGDPEIVAVCRIYNRSMTLYDNAGRVIRTNPNRNGLQSDPIRLRFDDETHQFLIFDADISGGGAAKPTKQLRSPVSPSATVEVESISEAECMAID